MITIDGKEYRNLEEQVLKNKRDIEYILEEEGVLNQFGIKVVDVVDTAASLPNPTTYTGDYGDAYAVGTESPYTLYVWTRANGTRPNAYWFNIGTFPLAGPKGDKGDKGDTGAQGPKGATGAQGPTGQTGATGAQGPIGPQGPQGNEGKVGATGPKGDPGEPFVIAGKLTSIDLLPNPSTVGRNTAYLIPDAAEPGTYDMYVITGDTTLTWENAGHVQSVQGPQGPTGQTGPQGPQGPIGATGPQGSSTFIYDGVLSASVQSVPIAQITVPSGKILQVGDILISSYVDSVGAFARVTSLNTTNADIDFVGTFQTYIPLYPKQGVLNISGQSDNVEMQVLVTVYDGMTAEEVVDNLNSYNIDHGDNSVYPAQGTSYDYNEAYVGIGYIDTERQVMRVLRSTQIMGTTLDREVGYDTINLYILGE